MKNNLIVENTGYWASREGSSRDVGQSASNTGHPILYGMGVNPTYIYGVL